MKDWGNRRVVSRHDDWIGQLIKHMGCRVTDVDPTRSISADKKCTLHQGTSRNCPANATTLVYRLPSEVVVQRHFFAKPEDAAALRTRVFQSLNVTDVPPRTSGTRARIAFIDRKRTRRILNLENMTAAVRAAFPLASLETAYMEDLQPFEQFIYRGQHDIIVTGHGAAMASAF